MNNYNFKRIVVEGIDNSGKDSWVKANHPNLKKVNFPDRNGKYSKEINDFLSGKIPHSPEVDKWFLENRLDWYENNKDEKDLVFVRSGISYLAYKWYRDGVEPSKEEFDRERELLRGCTIIYLNKRYKNPDEKTEIYDNLEDEEYYKLQKIFYSVLGKVMC